MSRRMLLAAALLAPLYLTMPGPVAAQGMAQVAAARAAGTVGERYDGYLGVAGPVDEGTRRAVAVVNIKRRALYSDLAARRGVSPQEVGITAACQLLGRVEPGEAYLLGEGGWRRRAAGQAAPRPDYCG